LSPASRGVSRCLLRASDLARLVRSSLLLDWEFVQKRRGKEPSRRYLAEHTPLQWPIIGSVGWGATGREYRAETECGTRRPRAGKELVGSRRKSWIRGGCGAAGRREGETWTGKGEPENEKLSGTLRRRRGLENAALPG
jgi:hypothetical protein